MGGVFSHKKLLGTGFLSNQVIRQQLKAGDHIYTWRTGFIYSHHGIYMGEGRVIHFTQDVIGSFSTLFSSSSSTSSSTSKTICPSCEALGLRKRTSGVIESCLDCFLEKGYLFRYVYGVSEPDKYLRGTCSPAESDAADVVMERAVNLVQQNGFGEYNVLFNNCEHFALYCKTGSRLLHYSQTSF